MSRPRLVIGMSGSSGPQIGVAILRLLRELRVVETHLIVSRAARETIRLELGIAQEEVESLADVVHAPDDLAAGPSSGSFRTIGTVIAPCSMKTLAAIAHGYEDSLLARAALVALKERRRLVVVPRETPLALPHLRNLVAVAEAGGVVLPPVPAFYHRPATIDDLLAHTAGKVLDLLGIEHDAYARWAE